MKKSLPLVVLLVIVALGAWRAAVAVPTSYTLTRAAKIKASSDDAWKVLSDLAAQPEWRSDLSSVEEQPKLRGHKVWRENWRDGTSVDLETVESFDGRRMVRCVTDQDGAIGGCWTVEIVPRDENCAVQITENIKVHSGWFRFTHSKDSRTAALDQQLTELAKHFGDDSPRLGKDFPEVSREPEPPPEATPEAAPEAPAEPSGL